MKNSLTKIMIILLSGAALIGCGKKGEDVDKNKSQLYVSNFNGGYGDGWLKSLKTKFEAKYAEKSFEEGKKGVQIIVDNNKVQGDHLMSTIKSSINNVYFAESVSYYDYINEGIFADLTDIVKTDLTPYGDTGTIFDKISDQQKEYLQSKDGKIYSIPHYMGFYGLTYDLKLWEDKKLYIAADPDKAGKVNALYDGDDIVLCKNSSTKKSNGPDGEAGTYDDGFPATYKELSDLMAIMVKKGITPINWTGKYQKEYNEKLMAALYADFEGPEQCLVGINFKGNATHLVQSIDADGKITYAAPTKIENSTGYNMYKTAGRYYAIKFFENIVSNYKYYGSRSFTETEDHLGAQQTYLLSYPEEAITGSPIAMLPEGNYWENEANNNGVFEFAANNYGPDFSRANRQIAMMPMPKATDDQVGEKTTLLSFLQSSCFMNSNCDSVHKEIAKEFILFANTNESLVEFNLLSNAPKALKYTMTKEQYQSLNCFGKSVYDLAQNSNIVEEVSLNPLFANNIFDFNLSATFISKIGSTSFNNVVKEMCPQYTTSTKKSVDLFNGVYSHFQSNWSKYSKYF